MKIEIDEVEFREEQRIINQLALAYSAFCNLPELHPQHQLEFCYAIHKAQQLLLCRTGIRAVRSENGSP